METLAAGLPGRSGAAAGDAVPGGGRDRPGERGGRRSRGGRADRAGAAKGWSSSRSTSSCAGRRGLVQPAVKCRGPEYLRIIYGPDYDADENLARLRHARAGAQAVAGPARVRPGRRGAGAVRPPRAAAAGPRVRLRRAGPGEREGRARSTEVSVGVGAAHDPRCGHASKSFRIVGGPRPAGTDRQSVDPVEGSARGDRRRLVGRGRTTAGFSGQPARSAAADRGSDGSSADARTLCERQLDGAEPSCRIIHQLRASHHGDRAALGPCNLAGRPSAAGRVAGSLDRGEATPDLSPTLVLLLGWVQWPGRQEALRATPWSAPRGASVQGSPQLEIGAIVAVATTPGETVRVLPPAQL